MFINMRHRIFIASHLPDNIKKIFIDYQQRKLSNHCFRLLPERALHLTLIFIGYVFSNDLSRAKREKRFPSDSEGFLLKINRACQNAASLFSPIEIKLKKISYGPNLHSPRLIWAEGETSKYLDQFHKTLETNLINEGINFKLENRLFKPHITLARFEKDFSQKLPLSKEIEEKIENSFLINSISVIESKLSRQGPEYTDLATSPLNK